MGGCNSRFSEYPIALPDMVRGITDWTHNSTYAPLQDFDDHVQTNDAAFPMRIGEWNNVSLSSPFVIGRLRFVALAVTELTDVCKRYEGCARTYSELVVITKYNASLSRFEPHQRLLQDTSAVAIEHMRIPDTNAVNSARDYLAIANSQPRKGSNVNVYFWNVSSQLFVLRQQLSTELPGSRRYVVGSPRGLKYFFVSDPGIHFLAVAFYFAQTRQSVTVFRTESYVYSWVHEGRTVMEDASIDPGLGFQVFQLLRTDGATSFSHLQIPCDCQQARVSQGAEEACEAPIDILTVTNSLTSRSDGRGGSHEAGRSNAGAQIWRFRARVQNTDSSMWRLHGNVGVFQLLQSLIIGPTISSASFQIEQQGCFLAYLCRNSSLELPGGAEWKRQGEIGGSITLWEYKGGAAPRPCLEHSGENASGCAFTRIQVAGRPNETEPVYLQTLGRSVPHQMSRGPYSCSPESLGCIVGAQSLRHMKSSGEHYLVIAQSVCEPELTQERCNDKTEHGKLEVRSTVLQWDRDARQMNELLSISSTASRTLRGESIATSEERRLHSYPFRFPAGRASTFSATEIPVGQGPTKRHDRTLLILSSRTAGAIVYDWDFPVVSGLNGSSSVLSAIAGATFDSTMSPADKWGQRAPILSVANWCSSPVISLENVLPKAPEYVYVLSQIDRALMTLEKRPVLDVFGNVRSQLAITKTLQARERAPGENVSAANEHREKTSRDLDLRGASALRFVMIPHAGTSDDGDGKLTREEYSSGFDIIDADPKDGFITKKELGAESIAPFSLLDKDDGKLSRAEYEAGFGIFDFDGDGYISKAALSRGGNIQFRPVIAAVTRAARGEKLCGPFAAGPCQSLQMSVQQAQGDTCDMLAATPQVTPNGTVLLETKGDRIGTCTFQVVTRDSSYDSQIPGAGVSSAHTFRITVRAVNDQPRFDVVDVYGRETVVVVNQSLVFAYNATPGATLRSSQLLSLGEVSPGIRFHLVETYCFIKVRLNMSWDQLSPKEILERYEAAQLIRTEGYTYDGPYAPCTTPEAKDVSDEGLLWAAGSEPQAHFMYSSDGMFGTVQFAARQNAIGFAEFQAVLIDNTEPSSALTGAVNTSEAKTFRIWVRHSNERPSFSQRVVHGDVFSPPSVAGSPLSRPATEKEIFAVDRVSACSLGGESVNMPKNGLKWQNIGLFQPSEGRQLTSPKLAAALQTKLEFTEEEWAMFGISHLQMDDFIKSGSSFFKPDQPNLLLVLEKLRLKSKCPVDERDQRYLFHVFSLEAHSGNFEGSNADVTRNGGDLFEPHSAEIRCDFSALAIERQPIFEKFESDYLLAKSKNKAPEIVAALKLKADSVYTIDLSTNVTVIYPDIDILGVGGRWEAEEDRLEEEYCAYCRAGLCLGYCLDGDNGCRGGTCKDKINVTNATVDRRFQAADRNGDSMISIDEALTASDSVFSDLLGFAGSSELFFSLDTSRDSFIDVAELRAYLIKAE